MHNDTEDFNTNDTQDFNPLHAVNFLVYSHIRLVVEPPLIQWGKEKKLENINSLPKLSSVLPIVTGRAHSGPAEIKGS